MSLALELKNNVQNQDPRMTRDSLLSAWFPETKQFDPKLYVDGVPCDCMVVLLESAGKKVMGMQTDERTLFANKTWVLVAMDEGRDVRLTVDIPQDVRNSVVEKDGESWSETKRNAGMDYVISTNVQKSLNKKIERR